MAHSNQIREFLLTDKGIVLQDVYLGPAGVLTGSARLAQEAHEEVEEEQERTAMGQRRQADDEIAAQLSEELQDTGIAP